MADYPLVEIGWVRRMCMTSPLELVVAHRMGYVQSDAASATLWANLSAASLDRIQKLGDDATVMRTISDKYFALLLINLFERWFIVDRPRWALESLVIGFRESNLLSAHDGKLPAGVAGISEHEPQSELDAEDYRRNVRIHIWLGSYATVLLDHDLLRRPLL